MDLIGQVPAGQVSDTFEAKAQLRGSYAQGAGCQVTTPPVVAPPAEAECRQVLAGRTVMPMPAGDVTVRDKTGDGGEVNADGWAAAPPARSASTAPPTVR